MKPNRSVMRLLQAMDYLAEHKKGAALSEIAHALGEPKTSVYDLLVTAVNMKYLRRHNRKFYIGKHAKIVGDMYQEKQALLAHQELLQNSGVEVEDYGDFTVVVRAVPADVPVDDVGDMVLELANHLLNGGRDALREKTEWVLHSIACRAAIKAGDRTTTDEMLALAQKIMDGSVPPFCPHGRPCVLKLTRKELEKQFGRIV